MKNQLQICKVVCTAEYLYTVVSEAYLAGLGAGAAPPTRATGLTV